VVVQVASLAVGEGLGTQESLSAQEEKQVQFPLSLELALHLVDLEEEFAFARF